MEKYLPKLWEILSKKTGLPKNYFYCNMDDSKIYLYKDRWDKNKKPVDLEEVIDTENQDLIKFAISKYGTKIEIT